jgi:putative Mn2+ efflux pump MntP
VLRLLAFVLPLGLDALAVAAAIGAAGPVTARRRVRVGVIFVVFEAGMPLVGVALGAGLARAIGGVAEYLAAAAVACLGLWLVLHRDDDEDEADRLLTARGMATVALGAGISLDELAIGFSLGLVRLPLLPVIIAIAVQALIAAQLGLTLGARISERLREQAGRIAGAALILLGCYLLAERLATGR